TGTRYESALRLGVPCAHAFIIGIEQKAVGLATRLVARLALEQEFLEKPAGMGEMPFARTGEGRRLYRHVRFAERTGQLQGTLTNSMVMLVELHYVDAFMQTGSDPRILPGGRPCPA